MRTPLSPTVMISGRFNLTTRVNITRLIAGVLLLTLATLAGCGRISAPATKSSDASNLRQIGQASLIYAQEKNDQLPRATDVWDYAESLAKDGGLESAVFWVSREERDGISIPNKILRPSGLPDPEFRKLKLAFAVPVNSNLSAHNPATTPIAWTRGLQPDGTWSKDSPYKGAGGHIMFIAGNLSYFKNLKGDGGPPELTRFDGKGKTANILEALPPGARISEYVPSTAEIRTLESKELWARRLPALIAAVVWLNIVVIGVCMWIKKILKPAIVIVTLTGTTVLLIALAITVA